MSVFAFASCGSGSAAKTQQAAVQESRPKAPAVNADSAHAYVARQVSFGPRVPGTEPSRQCAQWLVETLGALGAGNVTRQQAEVTAYNGDRLPISNISAQINPAADKRILLLAHWDTRPWADQEPDPALRDKPIDGANDGASGVGVILEILRAMRQSPPSVGVDMLFVDAEDYGTRADAPAPGSDESWALGTQYWMQYPTLDLSKVRYAVLLDMVGGKDAVFPREYFSNTHARGVVDKIWRQAEKSGFGSRFPNNVGGAITDDHVHLIAGGIPAVDIIEIGHPATGSFNPSWHTHADNLDGIDRETLRVVAQTVINQIYEE